MARVPRFFANLSERRGFSATVTGVEHPSPGLLRLTFEGPELRTRPFAPCDVTAFRISANDFRHYTPERVDAEAGRATILFHRHPSAGAPGLVFVEGLEVGSEVVLCGMASARNFRWTSPDSVLAMGDSTTLGLMVGLTDRARAEGRALRVAVEVEARDLAYVRALLPDAVVVEETAEPGEALDKWLVRSAPEMRESVPSAVYLAGHGGSVQRQRAVLRESAGLDRRTIHTQPYWATGKVGL
ncbi:SIP domain-containing protein [Streptomyces sp. XM4193]|uniref:siderophore-interacting protein n=1 Tax=Streptomyces sp. XM4193 TaxID=2929782 RepID=UPI001FF841D6|nr:SIP domain-containing protein [Streptomyces sp. XM4193]MCK1794845.1 SIP domain-containing protein [Streptomyces sp. XM4193]